ncbi:MAG: hypothetical protein C0174_01865 [Thermodesulfobium narugense]|nr:MAG: hypothetical protein C0174_01865 [Thermodesulfobium narugense]
MGHKEVLNLIEIRERDLVRDISNEEEIGISKVRRIIATFLTSIKNQVLLGKRVRIKGLGTFYLQQGFEGRPKIFFVDTSDEFDLDIELLRSDLVNLVSLKENLSKNIVDRVIKSFIYKLHKIDSSNETRISFKDFGFFIIKDHHIQYVPFDQR